VKLYHRNQQPADEISAPNLQALISSNSIDNLVPDLYLENTDPANTENYSCILLKDDHCDEYGEADSDKVILDPTNIAQLLSVTYLNEEHLDSLTQTELYTGMEDEEEDTKPQPYSIIHDNDENYFFFDTANTNEEIDEPEDLDQAV
jgi:hypothetical protein